MKACYQGKNGFSKAFANLGLPASLPHHYPYFLTGKTLCFLLFWFVRDLLKGLNSWGRS